jgi:hypothetical protein
VVAIFHPKKAFLAENSPRQLHEAADQARPSMVVPSAKNTSAKDPTTFFSIPFDDFGGHKRPYFVQKKAFLQ